jgi:hypothetical protein
VNARSTEADTITCVFVKSTEAILEKKAQCGDLRTEVECLSSLLGGSGDRG